MVRFQFVFNASHMRQLSAYRKPQDDSPQLKTDSMVGVQFSYAKRVFYRKLSVVIYDHPRRWHINSPKCKSSSDDLPIYFVAL